MRYLTVALATALVALLATQTQADGTPQKASSARAHVLRFVLEDLPHGRENVLYRGRKVGVLLRGRDMESSRGFASIDALLLRRGQIFLGSAAKDSFDEGTAEAVLGGTRHYAGVHGTAAIDFAGSTNRLTLRLE